ncbi:thiamine-phosphate kinase [Archaeoglobus profundus]|uniref:Thiamine-monophosphate kinase n=1 Tax=Archaeoglobus profundus (strain DSM 5631 / JCM 9629 / NBRC 100127 / Av18) TaxID=572546 RepID=D2RH67_ARCPA|nr:thiamine-phosphate kinase [Archaeoglobus profundus]ADB57642.1 thiamine-monophosphate kinase [Archaeoglobus profundus DSM 5631]
MREFELIGKAKELFRVERDDVIVGIDDDCALVDVGTRLALTTDCLHEKTDFPKGIKPEEIGHLALAINLSDLASCGAKPLFFLYTITLSDYWIEYFERILKGMKNLADKYGVAVVGGDTDFGDELHISGFAIGKAERFVGRDGAKVGDKICVTGLLGKAQLSLEQLMNGFSRYEIAYPDSLFKPEPRVEEGLRIAKHANSMTDISDSLAISLHQIAKRSGVGIKIYEEKIPLDHLTKFVDYEKALELFLYSGGDYELVFTSKKSEYIEIGEVIEDEGVWIVRRDGRVKEVEFRGYAHL